MTFKTLIKFPSKLPNAWFYYSLAWVVFAMVSGIIMAKTGNKHDLSAAIFNLLAWLFLILSLTQAVINFIRLLKSKPKFNLKKVIFVIILMALVFLSLSVQYAIVKLNG